MFYVDDLSSQFFVYKASETLRVFSRFSKFVKMIPTFVFIALAAFSLADVNRVQGFSANSSSVRASAEDRITAHPGE